MADEQSALKRAWRTVKKYAAKVWSYLKVAKMEYIVMASLFALDLISKAIVNATTKVGDIVVLIPYFLNVHNIHNYDAAFGSEWMTNALGSMGSRILFSIFAVIASVVFIFILIRNKGGNKLLRVSFAMLVAGALGNCVDRMFLGYVRDFVEFVYFGLTIGGHDSFYVFNIADAELVIGVILVLIYFIFMYRDKPEDKKAVAVADGESVGQTAGDAAGAEKEADVPPENEEKAADGVVPDASSEDEEKKADDASSEDEEKSPSQPAEETAAADGERTEQEPAAVDNHEDEPSDAEAASTEKMPEAEAPKEAEPVAKKPTARKTTARKAATTAPKSSAAGKTTARKTTAKKTTAAGTTAKKPSVKAAQDKNDGEATTE